MTKSLCILGSTGSIGTQSLDVARMRGYTVEALTAYSDVKTMEEQIREFRPQYAAMADEAAAADLKARVADTDTKVLSGQKGVGFCAAQSEADTVLNSIVGMAGLAPTLAAIRAKKRLALANKETLVAGGQLVMDLAKQNGVPILPVDSEHSAIFQALQGAPTNRALKKIILTASGGPFFGKVAEELKNVTVKDALHHPNWAMGAKITVDSATMMNKGLELIEAVWLFGVSPDAVQIVVHRESILHSAVVYDDNSSSGRWGFPICVFPSNMRSRTPNAMASPVGELDFAALGKMTFYEPDYETFRCINLWPPRHT